MRQEDNRYVVTNRERRPLGIAAALVAAALIAAGVAYWTGIWSPTSMQENRQGAGLHLPENSKATQPGVPHTGGRDQR